MIQHSTIHALLLGVSVLSASPLHNDVSHLPFANGNVSTLIEPCIETSYPRRILVVI
jgi:hypothetical protein